MTDTNKCVECGRADGQHNVACMVDRLPAIVTNELREHYETTYKYTPENPTDLLRRIKILEQQVAELKQESLLSNQWADKWAQEQIHLAQIINEQIPKLADLLELREFMKEFRTFMKD